MRRLLLRLLASTPATDHVPDAELLRRFVTSDDSAAFELVVRRHADAVWAACRRLLRSEADAEDAFQATFLALIRKAPAIRTSCAGGWLHRVAVHAALKLRERAARTSPVDPQHLDATPAALTEPPDAELAAVVHEELARLSERERLPVVLCDLEGLSHADAAKVLGWPVGTVSGRLSRARAKLRERLARRGVTPAAALFPALSAPPHLVPNALSLTAGAPPAVALLTEGVLSAMRTAKLKVAALVCVTVVGLGTAFALAPRPGENPAPADPLPVRANQPPDPEPKKKQPVVPTRLEPGIAALAGASTDVIIAEVLETNPRQAIEGGRDTVKLKVVKTLLGVPAPGDTIGVYYHLLWQDEAMMVLEPAKFQRQGRYLLFLKSHLTTRPDDDKPRREYEPVDQYLWVQPEHARLVKETAAAIRVLHGMRGASGRSRSARSRRDSSSSATRGARAPRSCGCGSTCGTSQAGTTPSISCSTTQRMKWEVTEPSGITMKPGSPPGNWLPTPARKLTLAAKESGQLTLSISGAGVAPNSSGHLELASDRVWEFPRDATGDYHLSGSITIAPDGKPGAGPGLSTYRRSGSR